MRRQMDIQKWEYSDAVSEDRQRVLLRPPSFQAITSSIAETMRVLCRHLDACDEADGYERVVYCITVDEEVFDLFFNSPNGYRAWYFRSPTQGMAINARLLETLAPPLLALRFADSIDARTVRASLRAPSRKAWLAEVGTGFCQRCAGEWHTAQDDLAEIVNDRWELSTVPDARNGRKAPLLTMIRVAGGFVNPASEEYVPKRKRNRAQDIHEIGWS
jgi:hypothetical protein